MLSRWSDPDEPALNVLSLQAEQNFGKSFLARASLHEKVCHQEHDRLHISQIDLRKFELSPSNHVMVVGDLLMSRKERLGSIKKEWGIEDKTLSPKDRWIMAVRKVNLMNVKPLRSSSGLSNRNCLRQATSK